jgi:hypothetical protein
MPKRRTGVRKVALSKLNEGLSAQRLDLDQLRDDVAVALAGEAQSHQEAEHLRASVDARIRRLKRG